MNYAVIEITGHQYMVSPQDTIVVDKLDGPLNKDLESNQVLLYVDGDKVQIGEPFLKDVTVTYQIVNQHKGDKLRVFKYKAKSRYRKTTGFRPSLTTIKIKKIDSKKSK